MQSRNAQYKDPTSGEHLWTAQTMKSGSILTKIHAYDFDTLGTGRRSSVRRSTGRMLPGREFRCDIVAWSIGGDDIDLRETNATLTLLV